MSSGEGDSTLLLPGFPIRTPSDHSSVDSSPRLIAASHVLHRLLVPRHPPCALNNLATKMLASTMQFSNHERTPAHTPPPNPQPTRPPTPRHDTRRTRRQKNPTTQEPVWQTDQPATTRDNPHPPPPRQPPPPPRHQRREDTRKPPTGDRGN